MSALQGYAKDEIIERNARALILLNIVLGVLILLCHFESGARRWSAAVWDSALNVPGAPATWGVVILVAGLCMWVGRRLNAPWKRQAFRVGCMTGSVWFALLAGFWLTAFLDDMNQDRIANPVGIPVWLYVAYMLGLRARLANERSYG